MASEWACCTSVSVVRWMVKPGATLDGGKLLIEAVGDEPTSPLTRVPAPVDPVTPELPSAPNCSSTPNGGYDCASVELVLPSRAAKLATAINTLRLLIVMVNSRDRFLRGSARATQTRT